MIADPKTLESTRIYDAIVYTTRLEEMPILHKKIKRLDNSFVIQKILSESRPKYNYRAQKSNITLRSTMCFKLLKKKLKKLEKKETPIDFTEKVHTNNDEDFILTDVIYPNKITVLNAEDTENVGISKKINVVIVINNLFSNLCDVYITDWKCNIIEYHCTKLNDENINRFDPSKIRLVLDACCWYRRQHKVESIWPRNECSFLRFLTTSHKCPLNQCTCCCKPKKQTTDVTLYKPYDTDKLTDNFKTQSHEVNESLILCASRYKKPDTNQNINTCLNRKNGSKRIYVFTGMLQKGNFETMIRNECFEIINNQDILRFHADNHWRIYRQQCYQCQRITGHVSSNQLEKVSVCCKWKRDSFLFAEYKACKISANALRFLRNTLFPNICDQCKNTMTSPEKNQTPNLIFDKPKIEHTRTSVKPTLLKIGGKCVGSDVALNSVKNLAYSILNELKLTHKTSPVVTVNPPSTVKLKVTCNEVLGLDFEIDNVDYHTAKNIVKKFMHMSFTVKEDLKVVASLNIPMEPTPNEEFQVIAQILLNTQNCLKLVPLPPGSVIDLVANIVDHQSNYKSNINVKVENDGVDQPIGTSNGVIPPSREAFLKVLAAFKNFNCDKAYTKEQSNTHSFQNENQLCDGDNTIEIFDDSHKKQNASYKYKNTNRSRSKTFTNQNETAINKDGKTNEMGKYSSNNNCEMQSEVPVISSSNDHLHSAVFNIYDEQHASKLEPYDCFANVINCSKKCYAESFKSYLKFKTESNMAFPKISSIFSLQSSSKQTQIQTNEPMPSTSKDVSHSLNTDVIPSTSNKDINILNNLNANPTQQVMLYDPITKVSQLVYLTPILDNSFNKIDETGKRYINPIEQMALLENNANVAGLTTINQINDGNMPVALQSDQENSILPDILNDIPRNINVRDVENCEIVVKREVDEDVIVLDSD